MLSGKNSSSCPVHTLIMRLPFLLLSLLLFLSLSQHQCQAESPEKPNIIFIYADDLGMGMLGCYGQQIVKTPNIDRLAHQGVSFTRTYSSQYCCPARASLLMGVHDSHSNSYTQTRGGLVMEMEKNKWTTDEFSHKAEAASTIKPSEHEVFLPELLKKAGYVTGQFGKLDWGFTTWPGELERHGWDHYVGYMDHERAHGFYPSFLWKDGRKLPLPGNTMANAGKTAEQYAEGSTDRRQSNREGKTTYAPDVMLKEALNFMEENRDKPMFLFFSTNLPHGPVDIPPHENIYRNNPAIRAAYAKASGNNRECASAAEEYASMVAKLDSQVGALVTKAQELGIAKNTIFVFSADNGHEIYYRTDKGRGRGLNYHGGVLDDTGEVLDVFRANRGTIGKDRQMVELAGLKWTNHEGGIRVPLIISCPGTIPQGKVCDNMIASYDHMATFAEIAGIPLPAGKDAVSYLPALMGKAPGNQTRHVVVDHSVIAHDGWKLTRKGKDWLLFNLAADPGERHNLISAQPDKFNSMKALYDKEVGSPRNDKS